MKINDKPLSEVFEDIPFPLKIVVVLGTGFIIFVIGYVIYLSMFVQISEPKTMLARIEGARRGAAVLDPSIASDGKHAVMAYTFVEKVRDSEEFTTRVRTAIGHNKCFDWANLRAGLMAHEDTLIGPDYITPVGKGTWRAETPSIVYDPADTGREWKLFAYRYFWNGNTGLARLYSGIVMTYASDFRALEWSREEWVLAAGDGVPPAPYGNNVITALNRLHPDLRDVYFYARPSVVHVDGVLVMSLSAFVQGKEAPDRVVMLVSADHGRSWRYMGTPLRESDLGALGNFDRISGVALIMQDDILYMSAVFGQGQNNGAGNYLLEFENASTATLRRDKRTGRLLLSNYIPPQRNPPNPAGNSPIAFHEMCGNKVFVSENFDGVRHDVYIIPRRAIK